MRNNQPRSFSRRIGKTLSNLQEDLIKNELPKDKIQEQLNIDISKYSAVNIEIGIGMAEHFINQASLNPSELFLGFEPYLNGIANCLKLASLNSVNNFMLWPDDANHILPQIEPCYLSKFYVLFPDPWPKKKQKKRRFINEESLVKIKTMLKPGGQFIFASDIEDYFFDVYSIAKKLGFKDESKLDFASHDGYIKTKYATKAENAGRISRFMIMKNDI